MAQILGKKSKIFVLFALISVRPIDRFIISIRLIYHIDSLISATDRSNTGQKIEDICTFCTDIRSSNRSIYHIDSIDFFNIS